MLEVQTTLSVDDPAVLDELMDLGMNLESGSVFV
jgi:hypothetical protein